MKSMLQELKYSLKFSLITTCLLSAIAYAEDGVYKDKILLGQSADFSGSYQKINTDYQVGSKAYFTWLNAHGGVAGRTIELLSTNDKNNARLATDNTKQLLSSKVFALYGYADTSSTRVGGSLANTYRVPMFAPFAANNELRSSDNHYVFTLRATIEDEVRAIHKQLGIERSKKLAVVVQGNEYGEQLLAAVHKVLKNSDINLISEVRLNDVSQDLTEAVATLKTVQPAALIIGVEPNQTAPVIRSINKSISYLEFYVPSMSATNDMNHILDDRSSSIITMQVLPNFKDDMSSVGKLYRQLFPQSGNSDVYAGFVSAYVFADALKAAGSDVSRSAVVQALESGREYEFGHWKVSFSATNHIGSSYVDPIFVKHQ